MIVRWRNPIPQQGFLMRRELLDELGYLDESFNFTMDFEYWVRLAVHGKKGQPVPDTIAAFRQHEAAKTSTLHLNRISDRYRIYEKVFSAAGMMHRSRYWLPQARRSMQNFDRLATYIAYTAANSKGSSAARLGILAFGETAGAAMGRLHSFCFPSPATVGCDSFVGPTSGRACQLSNTYRLTSEHTVCRRSYS
jgi:hypothetical protein